MNINDLKFAALAAAMAIAVTGATVAATSPAFGAELVVTGNAVPTARVSYADLDLRRAAGITRLDQRVAAAAEQLCVGTGVETLKARIDGLQCRDATIAAAAPQVRHAIERATAQASAGGAITLSLR
jgi:UrcA family protein